MRLAGCLVNFVPEQEVRQKRRKREGELKEKRGEISDRVISHG